jgi:cold shock CspA family protein
MFGTIVFYNSERGFGFLRRAGHPADLFFHYREFDGDEELLRVGAKFEFEIGEQKGKPVARDMRLIVEADVEADAVRAVLGSGGAE